MFAKKKILVAGDLMLDRYTYGEVARISPEAPIPVVRVTEENQRPGGAGNAMLNLRSLGMQVVVLGRIGQDLAGEALLGDLRDEGIDVQGLLVDASFQTPVKGRVIASGQQLLRIDHEQAASSLSQSLEEQIVDSLPELLEGVAVVALSDYAKGFLTPTLIQSLITAAKERAIPVVVDPKGIDFARYQGATLIKPNYSEAFTAAGLGHEVSLDQMAEQILRLTDIDSLMITRSKEGIALFNRHGERSDFAARVHEVKDVTGAGDTVLAVITAALANGIALDCASEWANIAAGIAIERIGCARVSQEEISALI